MDVAVEKKLLVYLIDGTYDEYESEEWDMATYYGSHLKVEFADEIVALYPTENLLKVGFE